MKAVFFDWDGTLVDSIPLLFAAHNHVREVMGHKVWSMEEYREAIIASTRELYPKLYGDRAQEAQEILYKYIYDHHLEKMSVIDGALDLIETLSRAGVVLGVVSNKRHDVLRREVEYLGWQKYFAVYNGAGVAEKDKPSGVPLLYALGQLDEPRQAQDVIYVGDTESDLGCAKDAGAVAAYIRHDLYNPSLIDIYQPAIVAEDLFDLSQKITKFL